MTLALGGKELDLREVSDLADMLYKSALSKESLARAKKLNIPEQEPPAPLPHPEAGLLTLDQWKSLPDEERAYAAYVNAAKLKGGEAANPEKLTREYFNSMEPTEQIKTLQSLLKDSKLMEAFKETHPANPVDILMTGIAKGQVAVMAPDFHEIVKQDLMEDDSAWRSTTEATEYSKTNKVPYDTAKIHIQRRKVLKEMDARIRQAFVGKNVERKVDGWYVEGKLVQRSPYYGK